MNDETNDNDEPEQNDIWILYDKISDVDIFGIARVRYTDDEGGVHTEVLYDNINGVDKPYKIGPVFSDYFYAPLPEEDEWSEEYEDLLDHLLGLITPKEVAEILAGETYKTNGERGYEAARFFILDGISESITEFSVGHGHGPSRYARAVQSRVTDLPEWLMESALEYEISRWDGGFEMDDDTASRIVEIRLLQQELLDHDHEEDIRELVHEFDLEYDDYREVEC